MPQQGVQERSLTADTPVPFSIRRLWFELHELVNATHTAPGTGQSEATRAYRKDAKGSVIESGDADEVRPPAYEPQVDKQIYLSASPLNIRRQLAALASRLRDPRYDFLFRPGPWSPDREANRSLLSLSFLNSGEEAPGASSSSTCRVFQQRFLSTLSACFSGIVYDAVFWGRRLMEGGRMRPLLIVLEEAHAYIGPSGSDTASQAVRRIVEEVEVAAFRQ